MNGVLRKVDKETTRVAALEGREKQRHRRDCNETTPGKTRSGQGPRACVLGALAATVAFGQWIFAFAGAAHGFAGNSKRFNVHYSRLDTCEHPDLAQPVSARVREGPDM